MHTCVIIGQVGSDKNLICQVGKCDVMYHLYVCTIMLYYKLCIVHTQPEQNKKKQ